MNSKFLIPLFFFLLLLPLAAAEKGVGIMWATQSEPVNEGQTNCVAYSVYNPFSEDATIYLTASGALESLVIDSQSVTVPAGTMHDKAIPVSICFKIPKVYKEDCTAGIMCQRTCSEQQVTYIGDVLAAEKSQTDTSAEAAGSATRAVAAAPLTLKVTCEPKAKSWMPVIIAVVVIVILLGLFALRKRKA